MNRGTNGESPGFQPGDSGFDTRPVYHLLTTMDLRGVSGRRFIRAIDFINDSFPVTNRVATCHSGGSVAGVAVGRIAGKGTNNDCNSGGW